jgi:hypothetical protein
MALHMFMLCITCHNYTPDTTNPERVQEEQASYAPVTAFCRTDAKEHDDITESTAHLRGAFGTRNYKPYADVNVRLVETKRI